MNRLAGETSPYLLQHAENPVDWYPWGEEALERARELRRPILLSIGYSACHWCHVMAHESFEDPAVAEIVNAHFVPVKVDREERPDLDALYMQAVVSLTGHGGWPMTVFLTPEGAPFYGGTYYPPEPRAGMPSFRQVLDGIDEAWVEQVDAVAAQAARLVERLRDGAAFPPSPDVPPASALTDALVVLRGQLDARHGGFGGAPKFPPHGVLGFLLRAYRALGSAEALRMAELTLDAMAAGGIHDQLGGGFHRYAVDGIWLVPHFEKMLYDNALLAQAYTWAWATTAQERHRDVAESTLDYLLRELRLAHGGFASAQDADTEGEEGLTYVWTAAQMREVLGPESVLAEAVYGVTPEGNFEGATVLSRVLDPEEAGRRTGVDAGELAGQRARLLAARDKRPQPARDDKALAAWNGMALAALAEAGRRFGRRDYVEAARACAEFLLGPLSARDGGLLRTHRDGRSAIDGFLDDYAQAAAGLIELHLATREPRWLDEARRLARLAVDRFADREQGGFFDTPAGGEELVARPKGLDDTPTPSGNATLAGVLVWLGRLDEDDAQVEDAAGVTRQVGEVLGRAPQAFGRVLGVVSSLHAEPRTLVISGADDALAAGALEGYDPDLAIRFAPDDARGPGAHLCTGRTCLPPITDAAALRAALSAGS
jgi:uncharacterized protein YyaL (SSP411 family)